MPKSVTLVAPEDMLKAIQAAVPVDDVLWSDSEPMDSPLNPLDDPLGGIPIDYTPAILQQSSSRPAQPGPPSHLPWSSWCLS